MGTIDGALTSHLKAKTIMTLDIKDAFPNTDRGKVLRALNKMPINRIPGIGGMTDYDMAKIITDIATFSVMVNFSGSSNMFMPKYTENIALPQGASTSPRMFDFVFKSIDEKLAHLAENVGGRFTRYADNIFFSMPTEEFPEKIQRAITRIIKRKGYVSHKVKVRNAEDMIRALGLNIIKGKFYNTRKFKRNLRLTLYRLEWLKTNDQSVRRAKRVLEGQKSWAKIETLPPKLRRKLTDIKSIKGKQLKLSA